jgi:hypothetical protein
MPGELKGGYIGTTPSGWSTVTRSGVWDVTEHYETVRNNQWPVDPISPRFDPRLTKVAGGSSISNTSVYELTFPQVDQGRPATGIVSASLLVAANSYGQVIYQQDGVGFTSNYSSNGYSRPHPSSAHERFGGLVDYRTQATVSSVGYSTSLLSWTWSGGGGGGPNIGGPIYAEGQQFLYDATLDNGGYLVGATGDTDTPRHGTTFSASVTIGNMSMPVTNTFRIKASGYNMTWSINTTSGNFSETISPTKDGWFVFNNYAGKTVTQISGSYNTGRYAGGFGLNGIEKDGIFQTIGRTTVTTTGGIGQTSFPVFSYLQNKHTVGVGSTTYIGKVLGISGNDIYLDDDRAVSTNSAVGGAIGAGSTLTFAYQPPAELGITHGYVSGYGGPYLEVLRNDGSSSSNYTVDYFYCNYRTGGAAVASGAGGGDAGVWKHGRSMGTFSGSRSAWDFGSSSGWRGYLSAIRLVNGNDTATSSDLTVSSPRTLFDPPGSGQYPKSGGVPKAPPLNLYADYAGNFQNNVTSFSVTPKLVSVGATNTLRLSMPSTFTLSGVTTSTSTVYSGGGSVTGTVYASSSSSPNRRWDQVSFASTTIVEN